MLKKEFNFEHKKTEVERVLQRVNGQGCNDSEYDDEMPIICEEE